MRHPLLLLLIGLLVNAASAAGQPVDAAPPPATVIVSSGGDARETREQLRRVLDQHPPSVREVLRLDPTLLSRPDYLATYPTLAAFLQQHPEVVRNPAFFIGEGRASEPTTPELEAARAISRLGEQVMMVLLMATFTAGTLWLVKLVSDHRRWNRAMKAQTELHNKMIDRFATSEDLLAYLQSSQGSALVETPVLHSSGRAVDAPFGRILWSIQAGAVLGCAGAGLIFVGSRNSSAMMYVEPAISALGTLVLTIGIGFLVSAAVSFVLSRKLGLVQQA